MAATLPVLKLPDGFQNCLVRIRLTTCKINVTENCYKLFKGHIVSAVQLFHVSVQVRGTQCIGVHSKDPKYLSKLVFFDEVKTPAAGGEPRECVLKIQKLVLREDLARLVQQLIHTVALFTQSVPLRAKFPLTMAIVHLRQHDQQKENAAD
ncbi:hypothetical protein RvY_15367 [Ramazzottius varieornatus]|uniref:Uncharacterized protein n=1 Tax=Ramazzottius varieornatus TaxID=947166 RepID=A0A1D1W2Q4_RAMVA|nr:hypothetical protein RvY_15367 [Ramazzottius varieornatus]